MDSSDTSVLNFSSENSTTKAVETIAVQGTPEQNEKLRRCLLSAQMRMVSFLDDPEKIAIHNAHIAKLIKRFADGISNTSDKSNFITEAELRKIDPEKINELKAISFKSEISTAINIASADFGNVIQFNPKVVDEFSDAEIEKMCLHEIYHLMLANQNFLLESSSKEEALLLKANRTFLELSSNAETLFRKINYLEEYACDTFSDCAMISPTFAHIEKLIAEYIIINGMKYHYESKGLDLDLTDPDIVKTINQRVEALFTKQDIKGGNNSHPGPFARFQNSNEVVSSFSEPRANAYLDRIYDGYVPEYGTATSPIHWSNLTTEQPETAKPVLEGSIIKAPVEQKNCLQKFGENVVHVLEKVAALHHKLIPQNTTEPDICDKFKNNTSWVTLPILTTALLNTYEALTGHMKRKKP